MVVNKYPEGCDVSNNNGHINWSQVATAGLSFMFAKADQGNYFVDSFLAQNWSEAKRIGLYRGAYHFADPDRVDAVTSADHFLNVMTTQVQLDAGDMLALDLEDGTGNLADWTLAWCQRVEQRVGFKPIVYTSPGFAHDHSLASRPELGQYGLWLASWGVPTPPTAPAPWDLVSFHQYAVGAAGSVPGVTGECDLNRFNGDASRIPLYGLPADPEPQPGPAPEPGWVVGPGILAKMAEANDQPASDEVYVKLGGKDEWSEAYGTSGSRYLYLPSLGRVFRFPPAA